jgi:glucose-1-phosphate thymidylyltransferase
MVGKTKRAIKMSLTIGIRAYLREDNVAELGFQVSEARKFFPKSKIIVAICGNPVPKKIAKKADKIVHYSKIPIGLTPSWDIFIKYAKSNRSDELIVVDGDDQHIFSEIKKIYREYPSGVIIPERDKRIVFISDQQIDGVTLEDLENAFLRYKTAPILRDIQTGVFIIKDRSVINELNFSNIDSWVGDLAFHDKLRAFKKLRICSPKIKVRVQKFTLSDRELVFKAIQSYEKYFDIKFSDLVNKVRSKPSKYLIDGRLSAIRDIESAYNYFVNSQKIKNMKALVLSGGFGERLRPITYTTQKQLIPVANKPILFYVIEDLVNAGIGDIGIIVGPNKEEIMETVGDGSRWKIKITYIYQDEPKGLAHAVKIAEDFINGKDFVMYLGDNLIKGGINDFVIKFNNLNPDASIMLAPVNEPEKFGIVKLNKKNEILEIIEKPKKPPSNLAIVGIYAFKKSIFNAVKNIKPSPRGELEITDALQWLLTKGYRISSEFVKDWWKDTGKPESLLEANHMVLDSKVDVFNEGVIGKNVRIRGRVSIGKGTTMEDNVTVRGPAIIGENCKVGPTVFIGPYTSIGNNIKIKNSEIEHSIVFDGCAINSGGRIVDSIIGRYCNITKTKEKVISGYKLIIGDNSQVEL